MTEENPPEVGWSTALRGFLWFLFGVTTPFTPMGLMIFLVLNTLPLAAWPKFGQAVLIAVAAFMSLSIHIGVTSPLVDRKLRALPSPKEHS